MARTRVRTPRPRRPAKAEGVLRDMVDDGDGINNLTDDATGMSGTTAAGAESSERETTRQTKRERELGAVMSVPCPCAATCFCRCPAFRTGMSGTNATVSCGIFRRENSRPCRNGEIPQYDPAGHFQLRKCGKKDIIRMHIEKLHRKPLNCENKP